MKLRKHKPNNTGFGRLTNRSPKAMNDILAYPLCWPAARTRTPANQRSRAKFQTSFAKARDSLIREIRLLGGANSIFSSNIPRRTDGLPYANARPKDNDPGIAVYFTRKGRQMCFACDRYLTVDDNMRAISLTIAALRGVARWGTGDMMEAAFSGFTAVPERTGGTAWWDVLGIPVNSSPEQIRDAYRALAKIHHPDMPGGDTARMQQLQQAYDAAAPK